MRVPSWKWQWWCFLLQRYKLYSNSCYFSHGLAVYSPFFSLQHLSETWTYFTCVCSVWAVNHRLCMQKCLFSPCSWCVPGPRSSAMRCRACCITWPVGLGVCVALSTVSGLGESGELGSESPSEEKYPLEARRGRWNIDLFWNTPRLSRGEMGLPLRQDGESGSPPALVLGWPELDALPVSEREVCAEAPAAPAGDGSPPLPWPAVTAVDPSELFGGLLDEQSGTVSLGFHHSGQTAYSLTSLLHVELQLDLKQRAAASGLRRICFSP